MIREMYTRETGLYAAVHQRPAPCAHPPADAHCGTAAEEKAGVKPHSGIEINFPLKASPGRGKLSPQVTDEGAGKQQLAGNYPSSVCSLRSQPPSPQGVKAFVPRGKLKKLIFVAF